MAADFVEEVEAVEFSVMEVEVLTSSWTFWTGDVVEGSTGATLVVVVGS